MNINHSQSPEVATNSYSTNGGFTSRRSKAIFLIEPNAAVSLGGNLPNCGKEEWIFNMDTDSLIPFIIIWGLPAFMVVRRYFKMNTYDKKSAINEFG